jgi:predicted Zn-dependent protease
MNFGGIAMNPRKPGLSGLIIFALIMFFLSSVAEAGVFSSIKRSIDKGRYAFEKELGKRTRDSMIEKNGLVSDPAMTLRVRHIGRRMARICDRPDVDYEFYVLDTEEVNAFAAPGGFIFVTRGLMKTVADDNELAFVIGHEVGHVVRKHSLHEIEKSLMISGVLSLFLSGKTISDSQWLGIVNGLVSMKRSRSNEYEADWQGISNSVRSGFSPFGSVAFFEKLNKLSGSGGSKTVDKVAAFFSTHPPTTDRIGRAQGVINEFADQIRVK